MDRNTPATDDVFVTTPSAPHGARHLLLREQRYRRHFLSADAKLNAFVIAAASLATLGLARNDFRLVRDHVVLGALLAGRALHTVLSVLALAKLRGVVSPQRHDAVVVTWLWATTVLTVLICITRLPVGEFQGPLVTLGAMLCVVVFVHRSPVAHRLLASAALICTALIMLWSPQMAVSTVLRVTGPICLVALSAVGLFATHSFEEQRRRRVHAEHDDRCSRRELAAKVRELADEKGRVEALSHARARFLATMSHELRTPMNAIIGLSNVLLEDSAVPDREHLRTIHDSARGLLVLLDDVLDFATIDARRLAIAPAPFDLRALALSVGQMFRPSATARGLVLDVQVDADLPNVVVADDARLRQVLVNLISNALKFTERGRVHVCIAYVPGGERGQAEARIAVHDTGIGMSAATIAYIFEPFYQADAGVARRYGGTGLGLAVSQEIVRAMDSELTVESELAVGSTFSFALKLPAPLAPLATAAPDAGVTRASPEPPAPLSILIVDDQPINRTVVAAQLKRLGHGADHAGSGAEAVAAVARKPYDLVIMDVHMPGMSGLEATREILASCAGRTAPCVVAMTAAAFEDDRLACAEAGMCDFLAKPVAPARLAAVVDLVVADRASRSSASDDSRRPPSEEVAQGGATHAPSHDSRA